MIKTRDGSRGIAAPERLAELFRVRIPRIAILILTAVLATGAAAQEAVDPCEQGESLFRAGKFEEARELMRRCLDESGESLDTLLPLTVMGLQTNRREEAAGYSGRAVALDPESPEARYWHGRALLEIGRSDEARSEWEAGLQRDATHKGILEGLAKLAMADGQTAKAYNILTQLQRSGVDDAWLHRLLADITASKGLWGQTLQHMNDLMVREEPDLDLLMLGLEVSLMAENRDQALTYGRRAVAEFPSAESYGGLGEVFFAREEVDSALVYLRKAVELDPDATRNRFNLANALEVAGRIDEAEQHFLVFLTAEPDDPVGQFNYGIHLQKQGRLEEALHHVSLAVDLRPDMLSARVVRVQMLELMGRYGEALDDIAFLRASDPDNDAELTGWERRLRAQLAASSTQQQEGKVHLLHLVVTDQAVADRIVEELGKGEDFGGLVVQFSTGPAAARGGDIGWIAPEDMVEPMRSAIARLELNETSPPVEAGGLIHLFKRIP